MRHPLKVAGIIAVAVTTLAVGAGTAAAQSSRSSDGQYSVSEATVSQSMVKGSSPTSLGQSPLAQTPAGKAAARAAATTVPGEEPGQYTVSTADVQYLSRTGKVLGTKHYGAASMGKRLPAYRLAKHKALSAHAEGTSSASGCVKVTVTQTRKGSFNEVLWKFHVWTDWCWTRSNQVVDVNGHSWYTSNFDQNFQWVGIVQTQANYYDFSTNDGHPKSAYYHYRMGHLTNCVFKYGCLGDYYPVNYLRSYYNGTWVWDTSL